MISQFANTRNGECQTMYMILYPQSSEADVVDLLASIGAPGFTEMEKVIGRGTRGRHFDNPIWPGAEGMIYTVLGPAEGEALTTALSVYSLGLEKRSNGLFGLHIFTWPCEQLI